MRTNKLWWISWYQPTADYRPINFPPREDIAGWWCSGREDDGATLCALVVAKSRAAAERVIRDEWPEAKRWRFCEEQTEVNLGDRFTPTGWMIARIDALRAGA